MVLESILEVTLKATLAGKFALMIPVIRFTEGRWGAIIRCIPMARANCASLAIGVSTSLPAVIIKSANSSMTKTIYGRNSWPLLGFNIVVLTFALYFLMFHML